MKIRVFLHYEEKKNWSFGILDTESEKHDPLSVAILNTGLKFKIPNLRKYDGLFISKRILLTIV